MKLFFTTLPRNVIQCFRGKMIVWHLIAILMSAIFVVSGCDWHYFLSTRDPVLRSWMFHAVRIGALLPIILPLGLIAVAILSKSDGIASAGWAIGQAEVIGALTAAAYKAVTGRTHPPHSVATDLSHTFRFGFLRGGVFWGWPSSHTTIAFAMAVTVYTICPKRKWLGYVAIAYALYIGIGISMTIHWLSDFVAGGIFGTIIGTVVGKSFLRSQTRALSMARQT
jgi:membrane-associated phospholipid phosphatase